MRAQRVRALLMGGQACVFYGAAEFSRDADWPAIRPLVEAHYFQNQTQPKPARIRFWFQELRTPELIVELARRYPVICRRLASRRPLLAHAGKQAANALEQTLLAEVTAESQRDKQFWLPLRRELEKLRHAK